MTNTSSETFVKSHSRQSLLGIHVTILEGSSSQSGDEFFSAEKVEISEIKNRLPWDPLDVAKAAPLEKSPFSFRQKWSRLSDVLNTFSSWHRPIMATCTIALASAGLYYALQQNNLDHVAIKGAHQVQFVCTFQGVTQVLTEQRAIRVGEQCSSEVIVDRPSIALLSVLDRNDQSLIPNVAMQDYAMTLEPMKAQYFSKSIELDASDQGEKMIVTICDAAAIEQKFDSLDNFARLWQNDPASHLKNTSQVSDCFSKVLDMRSGVTAVLRDGQKETK